MKEKRVKSRDGTGIYARSDGRKSGPALVLTTAPGTNLHIWDDVLPHLPDGVHILRYDLRGHGQSDIPNGPYNMGQLVSDAEAVCDAFAVKDALFLGLSVGGMVAQGLAIKRPDLIRALILSNTAARIGNAQLWRTRIKHVEQLGLTAHAEETMRYWFGRDFRVQEKMTQWQTQFTQTSPNGLKGIYAAIGGTDLFTPTSGLRIPTLGIAGAEDGVVPSDLVRETVDLIPGSQFVLMRRVGHLPCVEAPEAYARHLTDFIKSTGHI